ncbi:hypothetical protein P5G65_24465 [Paenibacillus chondroitinus]|uniref:Uncharacterized protein n=1 Tax=Paenibacillus chondroitinus TaxID=59842 RepID=A0ABU6DI65_9BACL|nr:MULTISPECIES: hypothetical protein [Paenibacillus]MCY9663263.1 hypothetical protein [Paenibacillus anseongense]MEB4797060.1 hypothetical protein [Paenibacillus chondroitinus]
MASSSGGDGLGAFFCVWAHFPGTARASAKFPSDEACTGTGAAKGGHDLPMTEDLVLGVGALRP